MLCWPPAPQPSPLQPTPHPNVARCSQERDQERQDQCQDGEEVHRLPRWARAHQLLAVHGVRGGASAAVMRGGFPPPTSLLAQMDP